MTTFITKAALAPVAASFALALVMASGTPASAQSQLTNGPEGAQPNSLAQKPHTPRRPLTVRRTAAEPQVAAAPVAPAVANPISGTIGAAGAVVGLPFQVLGGIFPAGGALKGGVTPVVYVGSKAKVAEVDEGWNMAVPVDHSGPTNVVENGDGSVSPLVLVGVPLRAVGTIAQTPFKVLGAPFGGTPTF